jgi:membrane protein implicated in regulation of membrane protease activity
MNDLAPPPRPAPRATFGRMLACGALAGVAIVASMALAVAAAFAAVVVVLAVLVVSLRRRLRPDGPVTLEGRRTAEGWVAEVAPR